VSVAVAAGDRRRDGVGEGAVDLVDADGVVTCAGVDRDPCDLLALEAEVGRAVVTDVDLDDVQGRRPSGRSAIRSLAFVPPAIASTCALSFGRGNAPVLCGYITDRLIAAPEPRPHTSVRRTRRALVRLPARPADPPRSSRGGDVDR
jgi:hypothetical protein